MHKYAILLGVLVLALLTAAGIASADSTDKKLYTAEVNSIFCLTRADMEAAKRYADQQDKTALVNLVDGARCLLAPVTIPLYIEKDDGTGFVKVRREGQTTPTWTLRKFLH